MQDIKISNLIYSATSGAIAIWGLIWKML